MKIYHQVLSCLFFLALTIKEGFSLEEPFKCYVCNSYIDDNCDTIIPGKHLHPCGVNQTICRKVEQHINYNKGDHIRIIRQCATLGKESVGTCYSRIGTYRFKSWYCHCNTAECNGSSYLFVSLPLTVTMIAALLGLRKLV